MSSTQLSRLSGFVLAAGGFIGVAAFLLDIVTDFLYPNIEDDTLAQATNTPWTLHVTLLFFAALLVVIGLPGLYARIRERTGIFSLIGFVLVFVGLITGDVTNAGDSAFVQPALATSAAGQALLKEGLPSSAVGSIGGILTLLGSLILGIVIVRSQVLPRWIGILFILGVVAFPLGMALGIFALGPLLIFAGFGSCGIVLATRPAAATPQLVSQVA